MKTRAVATLLALLLSACGSAPAADDTMSSSAGKAETSPPLVEFEPAALAYRYQPDTRLSYAVTVDQDVSMHAEGDGEALGGDEELPVDAELTSVADTTFDYAIFPGPEEGTYEIEVTGTFTDAEVSGTVNGEPFDGGEPGDLESELTSLPPIDLSLIVDEQGNVISVSGSEGTDLLMGDLGGLAELGSSQLGRPLGPAFPEDRPLGVGDTWTEEREEEGPDGPIRTTVTHTVTGVDEVDGVEVLVIESAIEMEGFEVDFSEFLRAFVSGFAQMGAGLGEGLEEEGPDTTPTTLPPEIEEMLDQIEFMIAVDPSSGSATTWFDPRAGIVRRAEQAQVVSLEMSVRAPDEETGELTGFVMQMTLDQDVAFDLIGQGAAG